MCAVLGREVNEKKNIENLFPSNDILLCRDVIFSYYAIR